MPAAALREGSLGPATRFTKNLTQINYFAKIVPMYLEEEIIWDTL